ncbi:hypothetical protein Trydic_g13017 [Trypoxylus dichotomus]
MTRDEVEDVAESKERKHPIQPKCFSGANGEDVNEFLKSYCRTAKVNKCSNETKLLQLPRLLRDAGFYWFETVEEEDMEFEEGTTAEDTGKGESNGQWNIGEALH